MKITDKERELKNKYICELNEEESLLNSTLTQLYIKRKISIPNIVTHMKNKNFEIQKRFYTKNINCYSDSIVGSSMFLYLRKIQELAMRELQKAIDFESKIVIKKYRIPLKNHYLDNYSKIVESVINFNFDANLIDKLYSLPIKDMIISNLNHIQWELMILLGTNYSIYCINRLKELQENEEKGIKRRRLML